ncbi:hemagglutinin/amebocyte aggregation factor [Plakobranchus ocellatus]|uniref:Hemagglutinin/amebocyte aggregation factor n=1 Tax=Plakobranchus ocellatus TaxID=259542 RepID=A0AAV3ZYB4_9GAST|nr:hemagglutinin/amebocyte aggregation factor [Plakobranchus ocellatus]
MMTTVVLMVTLAVALSAAGASGGFQTDWDQPFLYACQEGEVLKSLYSVHDNRKEDRRWRFSCGTAPDGASLQTCFWTGYVNDWDEPMSFQCPSDYAVAGLQSYHWNKKEDRKFPTSSAVDCPSSESLGALRLPTQTKREKYRYVFWLRRQSHVYMSFKREPSKSPAPSSKDRSISLDK